MKISNRRLIVGRLFASSATISSSEYVKLPLFNGEADHPVAGIHSAVTEANSRLKELVKTGHLSDAHRMFDEMPQRDVISWTTIISGYVRAMKAVEALLLFLNMWVEPGSQMDPFILSIAFKACAQDMNINFGTSLHGYCIKTGFFNSVFVGSAILDMYVKSGRIILAHQLFEEMPFRNVVSWTAIITGLVRSGQCKDGLSYFSEMWMSKVHCDSYTFASALKASADLGALNSGREIHTHTIKKGFDSTSYVANTLATMYNKCGRLNYGLRIFERMVTKDVVSWTAIITSYLHLGKEELAIEAFLKMQESEVSPNEQTFAAILSGCANLAKIGWGEHLHAHVLQKGMFGFLSVSNSIMSMYSKCGELDQAYAIFNAMKLRDIVSWSTIIKGYCQEGYGDEAFELLSLMRREGPEPTEFALASVLSVCGNMALLEQGRQLHAHVLLIGLENAAMIQSALINMYGKCGSIYETSKIFDLSKSLDLVTWTAMINGFAEHGCSQEAINLFNKLPEVGLKPDYVAFIGVLTACSHAGLVDKAFHYFNSMTEHYHMSPSKEHYGCMVDLLCRSGRLQEAEDMIKDMPFRQDDVVWSTLLRACRIHGDVDRGVRAAEEILRLDPSCAGTHITLANLYSSKGKWGEAAGVRKVMRQKGVVKEPGWSSIKVMDGGCTFVAGDRTHLQSECIYNILDIIAAGEIVRVMDIDLDDVEEG